MGPTPSAPGRLWSSTGAWPACGGRNERSLNRCQFLRRDPTDRDRPLRPVPWIGEVLVCLDRPHDRSQVVVAPSGVTGSCPTVVVGRPAPHPEGAVGWERPPMSLALGSAISRPSPLPSERSPSRGRRSVRQHLRRREEARPRSRSPALPPEAGHRSPDPRSAARPEHIQPTPPPTTITSGDIAAPSTPRPYSAAGWL